MERVGSLALSRCAACLPFLNLVLASDVWRCGIHRPLLRSITAVLAALLGISYGWRIPPCVGLLGVCAGQDGACGLLFACMQLWSCRGMLGLSHACISRPRQS